MKTQFGNERCIHATKLQQVVKSSSNETSSCARWSETTPELKDLVVVFYMFDFSKNYHVFNVLKTDFYFSAYNLQLAGIFIVTKYILRLESQLVVELESLGLGRTFCYIFCIFHEKRVRLEKTRLLCIVSYFLSLMKKDQLWSIEYLTTEIHVPVFSSLSISIMYVFPYLCLSFEFIIFNIWLKTNDSKFTIDALNS